MSTYRFIGSHAEIHGDEPIQLRDFGQSIEVDEQLAQEWIKGGCAIIPDEDFEEIGFTAEELRKYKHPGARQNATPDFQAKLKQAQLVRHHLSQDDAVPVEALPSATIQRECHYQFPPD